MNSNKSVFIYFLGKIIPAIAQLLTIVFGIRILGAEQYGKYNLLFGSAMIISSLFIGWIQQGILKFFFSLNLHHHFKRGVFARIIFIPVVCSVIATVLLGQAYFSLDSFSQLFFSLFTALFCCLLVILTLMQAEFKPFLYALTESFFYLLSIAIAIFYIVYDNEKDVMLFFKAMVYALLILFVIIVFIVVKRDKIAFPKTDSTLLKKVFRFGFPLTIWLFISNSFNLVDRFVVEHYKGYDAVGQYSSVYDLIYKVSGFITLPLLLTFHPEVSKKWNEKQGKEIQQLTRVILGKEIGISIIIFTVFFLMKNIIFEHLFKINVEGVDTIFITLAISSILWQASMVIQKPLELNYRQGVMIFGMTVTVILNFVLNIFFVPKYGIAAASVITLITTLFYFIFVNVHSIKELASINDDI
jgi:O-antigen/teichoic acid export membrane protein